MLARRPFGSREVALDAARDEWFVLSPEDWREAFSHHPKIGDAESLKRRFPATRDLSAREQADISAASNQTLAALADANRQYEQQFGYIFIVCATGKRADEMLAMLRDRLSHDAETELQIAADEQAKITELRLRA
jgi:2-oxo-4-hydroxy-4-carboxy-5-ureidoimidazoline decarboxylase